MQLNEKITELKAYLNEYARVAPASLAEYSKNLMHRATGERYFEKIVECATDLAFIAIKEKKLEQPEEDAEAFEILHKNGVISEETMENWKKAKSMRNFIAHQYGKVQDKVVYTALTMELPKDVKKLIREIEESA